MHKVARGDLCPHGHFYTITVYGNYESRPDRMALTLTPGLGPTRARRLVEFFGSVEGVLKATLTELEAAGLPAQAAQSLGTGRSVEFADDELAKASAMGINVVTLDDGAHTPGCARYMIRRQSYMCEAMSRRFRSRDRGRGHASSHPIRNGHGGAAGLCFTARGLAIISGLARGVDTFAHRGAVSVKGKAIAVFGTGVDVIYPKYNSRLADQVLSLGGALISEFPLGRFAAPQNFPIRNRIISGMSFGVLVVEAAEYSGRRITARCALEQNREVFAVPGNVMNKNSLGAEHAH
jgi:DNA processing protein